MELSINEIMLKSLKELDLSAAICMQQARQELLAMASIRDEYNGRILSHAMSIDKTTLMRILKGNPFYIRTGLKIANALCKDKEKGIPLRVVFHEVKEDMQS